VQNVPEIITSSNLNGSGDNMKPKAFPLYDRGVYHTFFPRPPAKIFYHSGTNGGSFCSSLVPLRAFTTSEPHDPDLDFQGQMSFSGYFGHHFDPKSPNISAKVARSRPKSCRVTQQNRYVKNYTDNDDIYLYLICRGHFM